MTWEKVMIDRAAKNLADKIDREVLWDLLRDLGWTPVVIPRFIDNKHAIDITHWLEETCKKAYERDGRNFLFESTKDAVNFILRWG